MASLSHTRRVQRGPVESSGMNEQTETGSLRAFCNGCVRETNHKVLKGYQDRRATPDSDGCLWWEVEYLIIQCSGCSDVHFLHRTIESETILGQGKSAGRGSISTTISASNCCQADPA